MAVDQNAASHQAPCERAQLGGEVRGGFWERTQVETSFLVCASTCLVNCLVRTESTLVLKYLCVEAKVGFSFVSARSPGLFGKPDATLRDRDLNPEVVNILFVFGYMPFAL